VRSSWEDSLVSVYLSTVTEEEASQKDWDMVFVVVPVVSSKWTYKTKNSTDGSVEKYKTRFVARRFSQQEGEDYDKTLPLVSRRSVPRATT
jgi:hypothetical protein